MRTINETYNVYNFDELSDEAKGKAHTDYLNQGNTWFFEEEAKNTIKEVKKLFHITLDNWCIGYRPEYSDIHYNDWFWCNEQLELKGNRARAFLWNNFGHILTSPKYYGKECLKYSRFVTERVYNGTCPLTGVCFDNDALDPMAYFCFGVEWDEKTKKRVMTKDRTLSHDNATTVRDVISNCVYAMFRAFNDDIEASESIEYFAEECEVNGWEFTEDGNLY